MGAAAQKELALYPRGIYLKGSDRGGKLCKNENTVLASCKTVLSLRKYRVKCFQYSVKGLWTVPPG